LPVWPSYQNRVGIAGPDPAPKVRVPAHDRKRRATGHAALDSPDVFGLLRARVERAAT